MAWLTVAEWVAVVAVLLVVVPLVWLFARRRWLSQQGGTVDCAFRVRPGSSGGWALGVARYRGSEFEWYRAFSLSLSPARVLRQGEWTMSTQRTPDAVEAIALYTDQTVATLVDRQGRQAELALEPGSMTGFLSWLEAAAPGAGHYGNTAS